MEEEDEVIVISDSEAEAPAPKRQRGAEADDVSIVVPPAPVLAAAGAESDDEVVLLGVTGEVRGDDASSRALTIAPFPAGRAERLPARASHVPELQVRRHSAATAQAVLPEGALARRVPSVPCLRPLTRAARPPLPRISATASCVTWRRASVRSGATVSRP